MSLENENATAAIVSYKKLLIFAGFYPSNDRTDKFYYLRCVINWIFSLYIFIPVVIEICLNITNFSVISNTMYYSMTQAGYLCKLVNLTMNSKRIKNLEELLMCPVFNEHTENENRFIKDVIRKSRIMSIAFRFAIVIVCVLYLLFPLLDSKLEDSLALPGWYPFNVTKYRNEIIVSQVMSMAVSAHNNSTMDLLNCTFIMLGSAQFEILQEKLTHLCRFGKNVPDVNQKMETTMNRVNGCIKHHQKIIEYVFLLDRTFSNGLFVQFIVTVVVICLTGFQMITVKPNSIQFATLAVYFFIMLFQITMYCWMGNDIMFKSLLVKEACYMSHWHGCEKKVRKAMFIIMERAKRPVVLTGGKFFNLTLGTFVRLMKSSYSYFAVLQRINSDKY